MAKFLNLDGLIYFWGRVKSYVDTGLNNKASSDHIQTLDKGGTGAINAANARTNLGLAYGTTAGTVCQGNDSRLSDTRTPKAHTHTVSEITNFPTSITPTAHNQAASTITAGTLGGQVLANATATATIGTAQVRNIYAGTSDMVAGTTPLTTGTIYIVYE